MFKQTIYHLLQKVMSEDEELALTLAMYTP